jgi:GDPmannose 4,6-dehydratase
VRSDPSLYRGSAELHDLVGDATKARRVLGWQPEVRLDELMRLMVSADRDRLQEDAAAS